MIAPLPKQTAQWIIENGFWMQLSDALVFDVLTETIYRIIHKKDGSKALKKILLT